MIKIISNGSKWAGQEPDTIEKLLNVLSKYSLDPVFEKYGNFVNRSPKWLKKEAAKEFEGCTKIFGNFMTYSHGFNIITDEPEIIEILASAIKTNQETEEYKTYKKEIGDREEQKAKAERLFNEGKINLREMYAMYNAF